MSHTQWGDAYERIQGLIEEGARPVVEEAMRIAKRQLDQLTDELGTLPTAERDAFAYTLCEEIVTLATEYRVLIRVQLGQCHDRAEAGVLSDHLIDEALAS